jgi:outer membrane immunogenic protein
MAKGGAAWVADRNALAGNSSVTVCTNATVSTPTGCSLVAVTPFNFVSGRQNWFGWTIGAGVEWVLYGGWSVKGEYDYMNFGQKNVTLTDPVLGPLSRSIKQEISEFKIGLNYLFGRPPVNLPTMW